MRLKNCNKHKEHVLKEINMMDANDTLSNNLCSTQRHCRYLGYYMCTNRSLSIWCMNKKTRSSSNKHRIFTHVAIVQLLFISIYGQSTFCGPRASHDVENERSFLQVNREMRVLAAPSIGPISSDQPTLSTSSFPPSQTPSKSSSPSPEPSYIPSRQPSSSPTLRPTTVFPTSVAPTFPPVEAPVSTPSIIPTPTPTSAPSTDVPTLLPTFDGTTDSSFSSTNEPTLKPSVLIATDYSDRTEIPTKEVDDPDPTTAPTLTLPTLLALVTPPTDAPSLSFVAKKSSLRVRDVTLSLFRSLERVLQSSGMDELDANCTLTWQSSVQKRIADEVVLTVQEYESLEVELRDVMTYSNETVWSFTFDVFMEIRTTRIDSLDPIRIMIGAFDSQSDKISYIDYLKSTNCDEFDDINDLSIHVPTTIEEKSPMNNGQSLAALYASLSVAIAAIVMAALTICCYLHFRNKRRVNDHTSADHEAIKCILPTNKSNYKNSDYFEALSVVGGKSKNSDISTLGDPIPFGVIKQTNDDLSSTNESCNIEYDFRKTFMDVQSLTDSQICGTIDDQDSAAGMTLNDDVLTTNGETSGLLPQHLRLMTALADDVVTTAEDGGTEVSSNDGTLSMEQDYEVVVPPGILGLILESHVDTGRPMVYNIKPSTVLSSLVKVGDYIDAVDSVNVKMMNASDVSRLIVQRQDEVRILEFARPMKRKIYHL